MTRGDWDKSRNARAKELIDRSVVVRAKLDAGGLETVEFMKLFHEGTTILVHLQVLLAHQPPPFEDDDNE